MSIVFIGPPAAGKSRAGKRLATKTGASYADTDKLFVREHGPIAQFIPREGEAEFRRRERAIVAGALGAYDVVSLGGGAILDPDTQSDLSSGAHTVILLVASADAIEERISGNTKRPLLSGIDSWVETFERRRPIYERLAHARFDTSFRPMWRVVHDVQRFLDQQPAARAGTHDSEPTTPQERDA